MTLLQALPNWKNQGDAGAQAHATFELDASAVKCRDAFHNCEPKTRTACVFRSGGICAIEPLEYVLQMFLGYPASVV